VSEPIINNWWRQGMIGGAKAHCDGIKAFSETDFTEDLKIITVPTFVMHGDDDQIVPIADSALLSSMLLQNAMLKGLRDTSARHVHHPCRRHNPRHPRLHQGLSHPGTRAPSRRPGARMA
jgi:pimeloyl-ACP methyl ester carboxylesterase